MKKYYDFLINIPEFGIKKGDVCYCENRSYVMESNGKVLPSYLKMDDSIIAPHPYNRDYEDGTLIIPNAQTLPSSFPGGLYVIEGFDVKRNKYIIRSVNDKSKIHNVSKKGFKIADIYYFFDSKGKIQMTYVGKDSEADEWRKFTYNTFKSKEEAQKRKEEIIVGWAACLR